jgi:hypothetical protein
MCAPMFEGWDEFYFMIGSSAAALIGLLFIVATLSAGRDRSTVETGSKLFTTPLVCHLGAVLVLSAAALVPSITPIAYALAGGAISLFGAGFGVWIAIGIVRFPYEGKVDWFDVWWYGIIPGIIYVFLGCAAAAIAAHAPWSQIALAIALMALLLTTIHNAWDLVTYLAPRVEPPGKPPAKP